LEAFAGGYAFPLDQFQLDACKALADGGGVLVAAPTGAGKTVVGEFAAFLALRHGGKCFYTTPIKALSNQKFNELTEAYGAENVGLLTGDTARNADAPVVVMTTEVLRNMLYNGSPGLRGLSHVVMDEVHYLADRFRGAVWEEVIIHLPEEVLLVSLSATVSNAEEFGEWLQTVRGATRIVVEEHRPVPLWQHVLAGRRLYDLFVERREDRAGPDVAPSDAVNGQAAIPDRHREPLLNRELVQLAQEENRFERKTGRAGRPGSQGSRGAGGRRRVWVPSRAQVVEQLDREGLLPAITFIFSRAGCEAAVTQCLTAGLRLTTPDERARIRAHAADRTTDLPDADRGVLGYETWLDGLERGLAAHHAGLLPRFKEVTEELFAAGLIKAVFATETLALGINMPARSVVLERLVKWNGEAHVEVTPGEYTQLTGRAGRRGIDVEGHAVVLWQQGFDPQVVAGLASTRTYPLRSSFRPSYNMAVNLVGMVGREQARVLLESSFAQFQADRAVVGLARQVQRNLDGLDGYTEAMTCEHGSVPEYVRLRRQLADRESKLARDGSASRRAEAAAALEQLRIGDVIRVPSGRRRGLAIVLSPGATVPDGGRLTVLTADRQITRLSSQDFPTPVESVGRVRVAKNFNPRSPQSRRDLASNLNSLTSGNGDGDEPGRRRTRRNSGEDDEITRLRAALRAHPVHGCPDREDHVRWAERSEKLRRETNALQKRVETRTNSIARTFDRVCRLLEEQGYLTDTERSSEVPEQSSGVTDAGRLLARLYSEADLLVAECLQSGVWKGLDAPSLAAVASTLVYSSRTDERVAPRLPGGPEVGHALTETVHVWARLSAAEQEHRLDFLPEPDPGFAWAAYQWCSGTRLDRVLGDTLAAGDFVRWTRQLIDLLDQISNVADPATRTVARRAVAGLRRGVVAYSDSSATPTTTPAAG
ncbi:MAG: ATP-dependent helicase HelY, partial [Frankiaceae bacterium]|nr:ATP-dependent helicase HelY [Frankiaceae bacterium]